MPKPRLLASVKHTSEIRKEREGKAKTRKNMAQGHQGRYAVGWFVDCLTSQQHASGSNGRICSDNFTCCHAEIAVADQIFHLTQSQYTDTGPASVSATGKWLRRPPLERKIRGSNPACDGVFSGSSHTSDLKIGFPVATLPGTWHYRVSVGTGRPGVSVL